MNLKKSTMSSLCLDTILHILNWVNSREVFRNCSISCRFLNDALDNDENQWCKHNCQHILEKDFDGIPTEPVKGIRCLTVNVNTLEKIDLEKIFPDVEFLTIRGRDEDQYIIYDSVWKNLKPHVKVEKWYENGERWYVRHYKDGEMDGKWEAWRENGKRWYVHHYKGGEKDGKWEAWRENGKRWYVEHFKDGEKDGKWEKWYKNGKRWYVQHYKDGEKDGTWEGWYGNGEKQYVEHYKDGVLLE